MSKNNRLFIECMKPIIIECTRSKDFDLAAMANLVSFYTKQGVGVRLK